jgi:Ca2+-binding RTX toxin-like protein
VHGAEDVNRMNGGPGEDWLDGRRGPGNVAIGSKGDDLIQAEGKIDGSSGNDTIESFGYQAPSASPLPDVTEGGSGKDKISGGSNGELLKGGDDNDKVFAGNGDDQLRGNGGNDGLNGEGGGDDIDGGSGTDVCNQGPGTGTLSNCP